MINNVVFYYEVRGIVYRLHRMVLSRAADTGQLIFLFGFKRPDLIDVDPIGKIPQWAAIRSVL